MPPTPPRSSTPQKVLVSILFTKRENDPVTFGTLYNVQHNFSDGTSLLSIHAGDNFEQYRPPSNLVAVMQDGQNVPTIPTLFLNWITFSE